MRVCTAILARSDFIEINAKDKDGKTAKDLAADSDHAGLGTVLHTLLITE